MDNFGERTSEDVCLLCRRNNQDHTAHATSTNSHFTPMGMIQSNTGRRNYETTVSIRLADGEEHEIYYGRSNLENTNPEIGNDPHTADYIFCQECEDKLAEIEGEMTDVLNRKLRNPNQAQNFPAAKISDEVFFRECTRVNPLKFKLFIYSIVWRQNLQQRLAFSGEGILMNSTEDKLRKALVSGLYDGPENNGLLRDCFPFGIITAEGFENATKHHISPHPKENYPEVFCVNEYLILLYDRHEQKDEEEQINRDFFGLPKEVFNEDLDNNADEKIRITFISDEAYGGFQIHTWEEAAKRKVDAIAIEEFAHALGVTFPAIEISPKYIFLDRSITDEQKEFAGRLINTIANWNSVENRKMTRFKMVTTQLPNRQGRNVPVYFGIVEIRNIDGNLYHRLGFYGRI